MLLVACAGERAPVDRPIVVVADASIASADASVDASVDAIAEAAPRVSIPKELHGDLFIASGDGEDTVHIFATTIGENGAAPLRRLTSARRTQDFPVELTPDGLVFVRIPDGTSMPSVIGITSSAGEREIVACEYVCSSVALGADGRIHYIDRNLPKYATVKNVSIKGGDARTWKRNVAGFWACFVGMTLTNDKKSLVLWANNALGWPDCKGKVQGIYTAPLDGRIGKPIQPKHAKIQSDDLHGPARQVFMRPGSDRYFFVADSIATETWSHAMANYSCDAKGGDVRLEEDDGRDWSIETTDTAVVARKKGAGDVVIVGGLDKPQSVLAPAHPPRFMRTE